MKKTIKKTKLANDKQTKSRRETIASPPATSKRPRTEPKRYSIGMNVGLTPAELDFDRSRVEQSLRNSELRYRRVFETAQDGILILDAKTGAITDVNPYLIDLLGYSREEFIEKKLWQVGAFKDIEASKDAFEALQRNEYIRYENLPLKAKGGRLIQVEFVSNVYLVGDEKVIQCNIRDITEHKQLVAALQENERKYRTLVTQSPDGIFLVDLSGNFSAVNKAICDALGFSEEEFRSMNIWDIVPEQYLDQHRKRLTKILNGESLNEPSEYTVRGKDGKILYIEVLSAPYYGEKGIIGFQGIARDITARLRAERTLREREERFRSILDNIEDSYYEVDTAGNFTFFNPALARMLGRPANELMGMNNRLYMTPEGGKAVFQTFNRVFRTGIPEQALDWDLVRPDGTLRSIELSVSLIKAADGSIEGFRGTVRDVTARKRAEESVRALSARQEAILAAIPDIIMEVDNNKVYTWANQAGIEFFGEDVIGKEAAFYFEGEQDIYDVLQPLFNGAENVIYVESWQRRKDGQKRLLAWWCRTLKDAHGNVIGALSSARDITARKQAEDGLRQAEAKYRNIFENAMEGIFQSTPAGKFFTANPALARMLGYDSPEELIASVDDLNHEFYVQPARREEFMRQVSDYGMISHFESEVYRKDGSTVWVSENARAARGDAGQVLHYEGTLMDITERKRAEEALRQAEAKYHNLFENAIEGIFQSTLAGKFFTANPALARMLGYDSPEELIAGVNDLNQEFYLQPARREEFMRQVSDHGMISNFESEVYRKDGNTIWISENAHAVLDDVGQELHYEGTLMDITARKRAEELLAEERNLLRTLTDNIPDAIYFKDTESRFIRINQAHARLFGLSDPAQAVGKTDFDFFTEEHARPAFEDEQAIMRSGQPLVSKEEKETWPDGRTGWVSSTKMPLRDQEGQIVGTLGISRDITARKQAEETLRQRLTELEAVHTVSTALRNAQTRDEALPILLDETLSALETDAGAIWLYHADSGDLHAAVTRGWYRQLSEIPMKPGEGVTGTVFSSGRVRVSAEIVRDPLVRQPAAGEIPAGWGGVCLPIRTGAITVGVLFVSVPLPRQITTEQVKLLESLTEMAGTTLHRMSLHEETVRQLERLEALHSIDVAITASMDLGVTLNVLLEHVKTQLNADATCVLLLNPHSQMLEYAAGRGFRTHIAQTARIRLGESFAGRAALERRAVQADDPAQIQKSPHFAALWAGEGFAADFGVPLIAKGEVKGVLEVYHRAPFQPGPDWISFLETLAGQAAIAIDNAHLFENLQRSNVDLALAYDATIEGWSRALDLRDKETEGHTQRVTEITLRLAKAMGIGDAELVHIRRGALLHDIGKMGVPDAVLLKPGPLTDGEWVIMRKHPTFAYEMLSPINYLQLALDIPYCHHEKWDGTGYPRGLRGEQIPLAARVFAIVDVWDALRSDRPYRPAWTVEQARQYLLENIDRHFDPEVVKAFLKLVDSGELGAKFP